MCYERVLMILGQCRFPAESHKMSMSRKARARLLKRPGSIATVSLPMISLFTVLLPLLLPLISTFSPLPTPATFTSCRPRFSPTSPLALRYSSNPQPQPNNNLSSTDAKRRRGGVVRRAAPRRSNLASARSGKNKTSKEDLQRASMIEKSLSEGRSGRKTVSIRDCNFAVKTFADSERDGGLLRSLRFFMLMRRQGGLRRSASERDKRGYTNSYKYT